MTKKLNVQIKYPEIGIIQNAGNTAGNTGVRSQHLT